MEEAGRRGESHRARRCDCPRHLRHGLRQRPKHEARAERRTNSRHIAHSLPGYPASPITGFRGCSRRQLRGDLYVQKRGWKHLRAARVAVSPTEECERQTDACPYESRPGVATPPGQTAARRDGFVRRRRFRRRVQPICPSSHTVAIKPPGDRASVSLTARLSDCIQRSTYWALEILPLVPGQTDHQPW